MSAADERALALLESADEALRELRVTRLPADVERFLFWLAAAARELPFGAGPFSSVLDVIGGGAREWVGSPDGQEILLLWSHSEGVVIADDLKRRFSEMPLDRLLVDDSPREGEGASPSDAREVQAVMRACLEARDVLEAVLDLLAPTADGRRQFLDDAVESCDALLRKTFGRLLFINDIRAEISAALREPLRSRLWWWSQRADLGTGTWVRYVLGELPPDGSLTRELTQYLLRDPELRSAIESLRSTSELLIHEALSARAESLSGTVKDAAIVLPLAASHSSLPPERGGSVDYPDAVLLGHAQIAEARFAFAETASGAVNLMGPFPPHANRVAFGLHTYSLEGEGTVRLIRGLRIGDLIDYLRDHRRPVGMVIEFRSE